MKKNIIKVSVFAILIGLSILGIKNLISVKVNNTGINYTEKQAYTVPDVAKNYNVPTGVWYTNKINRFFVPYSGTYQIYCTNRDKSFPFKESRYKSATDGKIYRGEVNELNSDSSIKFTPTKAGYLYADEAYVFSRDNCTSTCDYSTNYTKDEYNTVPATVKNWYIKQNAYWLLNDDTYGSYVDRSIIVKETRTAWNTGKKTIKKEINDLVSEATNYETYYKNVQDNGGLNAHWMEASKTATKEYKNNGEVRLGPYKMNYYSLGTTGYRFSGVSYMNVEMYLKATNQFLNTFKVARIEMRGKTKEPNFFKTGNDCISRQNNIWYPRSGEEFYIIINANINNNEINNYNFQVNVNFEYMIASGYEVKCNGRYKSNNDVQPVTVVDAKRRIKTEEIKKVTNTTTTGKYKVYIKKVDFSKDENIIGNVKFDIIGNVNKEKVDKTVKTNANGKTYVNSVTITNDTLGNDVYDITENSTKKGYIKFNEKIKLTVTKSEKNGKFSTKAKVQVLDKNGKEVSGDRKNIAKVDIVNDEIIVTIKNTKIEDGSFYLNIKKVSAGTYEKPLSGAEFNIKEWIKNDKTNRWEWEENGKTITAEKKGENGTYTLLSNKKINKSGTYNYWITETDAPDDYVRFTGGIKVIVTTGVKQNGNTANYVVKSVDIKAYKNNTEFNPSPVTLEEIKDKKIINLKMTNIQKGSYDLKINKVSSSSDESLSGAKFKVQKATKNSSGTWSWNNGTEISKNANGIYTLKEKVEITEAEPFDCYWITETQAPYGYNKFTGGIRVQVNKKIEKNKAGIQQYVVDSVEIKAYEDRDPTKTRVDFKGKNPVTWDTKEATITLKMKNKPQYDLALRKFITSINGKAPSVTRVPSIATSEVTALKNGIKTTAVKSHPKDALEVTTGDRVVYTIRIYNEGKVAGKATQIIDYLPEGLKLAGNSKINTTYGWTNPSKDGKTMVSKYLKDKEIAAFNGTTLAYRDVQIECEVIATKAKDNLKNIAEITADDGKDRDSTPKNVNRGNYGSTSQQDDDDFELLKLKPTINLGGTVWLDLRGGKETLANGLKDSDNKDEKGLKGVKVELYQKDDANPVANGTKIAETTTKDNGTYMFEKQPIDKWYYVKFTYNGQNYENTLYNVSKTNDKPINSNAIEKKQDRDNFNNGFNINDISDTELKNELGYFEDYNKLTYQNRKKEAISCAISAYTGHQNGKDFYYSHYSAPSSVDNVTINTIDFGITKRIEFDMKLEKDVYAATVTVNGKTQIYGYNKKKIQDSIKDRIPNYESLSETKKEEALNKWTITVVKGDYQRAIAEPDYNFAGVNGNGKLELYVTYKIAVKNQSMSMLGEVTKIKDYYDSTYTYVPELSWISSKNYSTKDLTDVRGRIINSLQNSKEISNEETNESTVSAYDNVTNNTLDIALSGKLQSGEAKYLYLTFKVKKDEKGVIEGVKTNTAEISAFKSYYKNGTVLPCYNGENEYEVKNNTTIAGRVDRDSIPNNLNKSNGPKEDDEDKAPGLNAKVEGDRTITGFVWEDARNNNVEGSMIGNGMYKQGSQDIGDKDININDENGNTIIKIELLEVNGVNEKSKYEGLAQENLDYKDKVVRIIDKPQQINGNTFTFNNVVAGDYIVKFTYGDGSVKYNGQDYKTTIFKDYGDNIEYNSTQNSNLSGAADVWSEREKLNNSSKTMKNTKAKSLADKENCSMTAETKKIVAEIEMNSKGITEDATYSMPNYTISGVNLGLVERPKAQLELNKTVSNVKVTLADGSILFDASQGVNVDNVAWQQNTNKNRGLIQLSMDQEIMHGASIQITYKLTVKNVGEVDYEGKEFYYTGKNHGNTVTTTPNTVVDYVSNNLQFNGKNNTGWEVVNADTLYKDGYIDQAVKATARAEDKVKTKAQKINTIVKTDALNTALEPGKSVDTTLVLTQVITPENKNDNLTYSNIAEIVEVSNTVGRKMAFSIVGNQDPTANTPSEIDASIAEKIVILPPFGDGNIVYYILGAVVGIILIGGITLIIKKVLIIK